MQETQEILKQMGFTNTKGNTWTSDWFGAFILLPHVTPEVLAMFIYQRGSNSKID